MRTSRRNFLTFAVATMLPVAIAMAQAPPSLHAHRLQSRAAGGDLAAAFRAAGPETTWVAWSVPMVPGQGEACCYTGWFRDHDSKSQPGSRGCRLDAKRTNGLTIGRDGDHDSRDAGDDALIVYSRHESGKISTVRAYSASCPVEAGEESVIWLDGVDPAQSVALLRDRARAQPHKSGPGDDLLIALALHADPTADAALIDMASRSQPMDVREDAIFWLGQARGERGYRELTRIASTEDDSKVLEKVAFSLSQSPVPAAGPALENMARRHSDSRVREEAVFWLGQRGGPDIVNKLLAVVEEDQDLEVRKKAVFALSQLDDHDADGVTALVGLVRHATEPAIRKEALFWLGQSDDPRAIASLEALLLHP
jgi:hypothetical protein